MARFRNAGIGIGATIVLIGVWVAVKSLTGHKINEECREDGDCKGMSALCLSSKTDHYCSRECNITNDCPAGWRCGKVGLTTIDAKGSITKGESDLLMCQRPTPSAASSAVGPATSSAASASAPPVASTAPSGSTAPSARAPSASSSAGSRPPTPPKPKPKKT